MVKGLEVPEISDTKTPLPTQARALLSDPRSIEGSFGLKNVLAPTLRLKLADWTEIVLLL